jgi:dUTP pyrophosphatase
MDTTLYMECEPEIEEFYKKYTYKEDSGFDVYCPDDITVFANTFGTKIDLGIKVSMTVSGNAVNSFNTDIGYMLLPRSSTGMKTPLRLSNSVGIIDKTYRGSLGALVDNMSSNDFTIFKGDRLFQLVPFHGEGVKMVNFRKLSETSRGAGGFGSTGK